MGVFFSVVREHGIPDVVGHDGERAESFLLSGQRVLLSFFNWNDEIVLTVFIFCGIYFLTFSTLFYLGYLTFAVFSKIQMGIFNKPSFPSSRSRL